MIEELFYRKVQRSRVQAQAVSFRATVALRALLSERSAVGEHSAFENSKLPSITPVENASCLKGAVGRHCQTAHSHVLESPRLLSPQRLVLL